MDGVIEELKDNFPLLSSYISGVQWYPSHRIRHEILRDLAMKQQFYEYQSCEQQRNLPQKTEEKANPTIEPKIDTKEEFVSRQQ